MLKKKIVIPHPESGFRLVVVVELRETQAGFNQERSETKNLYV